MMHLTQYSFIGILLTVGLAVCSQSGDAHAQSLQPTAPDRETFGLTEVEQIVGNDGLDRWYSRYRKQPQQFRHFGEYVLYHSFRKIKSGRRLLVMGSVLLLTGGTAMGLGVAVLNSDEDENAYDDDEYDDSVWSGMGDALLAGTLIFIGLHGIVAGATLAIMGGYKMRRYGRWRDRLLHAASGSRLSAGPAWEGVGLQVGSGRFFVGTGVRF